MKNQYFADRNDFCKYDLVLELLEEPSLKGFVLGAMLSERLPWRRWVHGLRLWWPQSATVRPLEQVSCPADPRPYCAARNRQFHTTQARTSSLMSRDIT